METLGRREEEEKDAPPEMGRLAALLQGGRPPLSSKLSSRQLESLAAFCEALLPSSQVPGEVADDDDLARFYGTSASMGGIPLHVAAVISKKDLHPSMPLLRIALWFLSTWYGTFAICGPSSLSPTFPFFRSFPELEQPRREAILRQLSCSFFSRKRQLFRALQAITVRLYFQTVDEKSENPFWKAIGYCGRDPSFSPSRGPPVGHLYKAVVDLAAPERPPNFKGLGDASPLIRHCDVVVVGSGSGGSVVAGVLATAGHRVIVLDKGSYFPAGSLSLLEGPSSEEMYEKGGMLSSDDLSCLFLAGATVGGGSTINWSASFKTPDRVLEEWREEHGLKLFGEPAFREALEAVCARMGVAPSTSAGTVAEGLNSAVLRRGCSELGYPTENIPVNAPPGHDCGWCNFGCKDGKKKSATETWLADMAASGNGIILAGCEAARITTRRESGRRRPAATGVVAKFKGGEVVIRSRITVAAGGALNTPGLLRRSGLKNPNIGRHLRLHPCVMAWGYFPASGWPEPEKKSYAGELLTTMAAVPREHGGTVIQTPALHPGTFAALIPWTSSADFRRRMARFSRTATLFCLTRDRGSGCSRYYPKSLTYDLDGADERALQQGTERMLRILAAAGAEEVGTHHRGGEVFRVKGSTEEELEDYVKRASGRRIRGGKTPICTAHQMGSCRMGRREKTSVVDAKGETWDVERLFVADTSVFPTALGVNPMVTVQAIAYCTAQNILQLLGEESDRRAEPGNKP